MTERDLIAARYGAALRDFLDGGGGEGALSRAYEIGRLAATTGIGVVELALIHDDALRACTPAVPPEASHFLIEALSPFEMTHRGFRESNRQLEAANRQLEAANRELEAFSYSVSHDLRAPLRAIAGFTRVLAEDLDVYLDRDHRASMERVLKAVGRMSELIDGLLDLSRVNKGAIVHDRVDLSELANAVVDELRARDPDRAVAIEIAPDLTARGDARLLRIVLDNLLGNAWKFTAREVAPQIVVGCDTRRGSHTYYVRDNGAGFDAASAQRLFSPFQRFHAQAEYPGTGIGLATVRRIVERHGGRIWADSEVGHGATFYFTC